MKWTVSSVLRRLPRGWVCAVYILSGVPGMACIFAAMAWAAIVYPHDDGNLSLAAHSHNPSHFTSGLVIGLLCAGVALVIVRYVANEVLASMPKPVRNPARPVPSQRTVWPLKGAARLGLAVAGGLQRLFPGQVWACRETRLKRLIWETRRACFCWLQDEPARRPRPPVPAARPPASQRLVQPKAATRPSRARLVVFAALVLAALVNLSERR